MIGTLIMHQTAITPCFLHFAAIAPVAVRDKEMG